MRICIRIRILKQGWIRIRILYILLRNTWSEGSNLISLGFAFPDNFGMGFLRIRIPICSDSEQSGSKVKIRH